MNLSGQLLIAMPNMGDIRFHRSVVFICEHSADGAMGLVVNKTLPNILFNKLLEQLEIVPEETIDMPIFYGGPVESGRGFILHTNDYTSGAQSHRFKSGFSMSATVDVIEDIAHGRGPNKRILALGYAGWGAGQLENEIAQNAWLSCNATADLVFNTRPEECWQTALHQMGVNPLALSSTAGHA